MERKTTIKELIKQLSSFEDEDLEVVISIDDGETYKSLSLVGKIDGKCALIYSNAFDQ